MLDLYLRADSEAQAKAALPDFLDADENWRLATTQWAFDPVGGIIADPAVFDGSELVSPASFVPGWHANIRLLDDSLLPAIHGTGLLIDAPATPARRWG